MDGVIAHTFKKIKTILKAIYQAFTGHDIRTTDDIFRQVTSGSIGRRAQGKASLAGREGMFQIGWHASNRAFTKFSSPNDPRFNLNVRRTTSSSRSR
jgi:hypothetical protein